MGLVVEIVLTGLILIGLVSEPKAVDADVNEEFIKIASDNWHFETKDSKQPFVPFGCNYYDPETYYTEEEDPENILAFGVIDKFNADNTDRHFEQLENIGVNTVRIFLSVISFEPEFKQLNEENFLKVDKIIELAKKHNIKIIFDLVEFWEGGTNDRCGSGIPCAQWMSRNFYTDETTLEGLEFFVSSFAKRYAYESTIFAWDLINEPIMYWQSIDYSLWQDWIHNKYDTELALFSAWSDYPLTGENWNNLSRPENENNLNNQRLFDYQLFREDIAYNWVKRLSDAIRAEDKNHFITVGHMVRSAPIKSPREMAYHNTPYEYRFDTRAIAPLLDYVSIHGGANRIDNPHEQEPNVDDYTDGFLRYSYVDKPVILEEFVYSDSTVTKTLGSASGWLSWACYGDGTEGWRHYFFNSNEQITDLGINFKNKAPSIKNQVLTRYSDKTIIPLNMKELLTDTNKHGELYNEILQIYNDGNGPVGFTACYPDNIDSTGKCSHNCGAAVGCEGDSAEYLLFKLVEEMRF